MATPPLDILSAGCYNEQNRIGKRLGKEEYIRQHVAESFGWWEEARRAGWNMILEPRTELWGYRRKLGRAGRRPLQRRSIGGIACPYSQRPVAVRRGQSQVVPRKIFRPLHKFMQGVFLINRKVHLLIKNRSAEERTAAVNGTLL